MKIKMLLCLLLVGVFLRTEIVSALNEQNSTETISLEKFCFFLNQEAASDLNHFYDEKMAADLGLACSAPQTAQEMADGSWKIVTDLGSACIVRSGAPGSYCCEVISGKENTPVTFLSYNDVIEYCAWKNFHLPSAISYLPWCCDSRAANIDPDLKSNIITFSLTRTSAVADLTCGEEIVTSVFDEILEGVFIIVGLEAICPRATEIIPALSSEGSLARDVSSEHLENNSYQIEENLLRVEEMNAISPGHSEYKDAELVVSEKPAEPQPLKSALKTYSNIRIPIDVEEIDKVQEIRAHVPIVHFDFSDNAKIEQVSSSPFRAKRSEEQRSASRYAHQFELLTSGIEIALDDISLPPGTAEYATEVAAIYKKNYPLLRDFGSRLYQSIQDDAIRGDKKAASKTALLLAKATIKIFETAVKSVNLENFNLIKAEKYTTAEVPADANRLFSFVPEEEVGLEDLKALSLLRSAGHMIDNLNALLNVFKEKKEEKIPELFHAAEIKKLYREHCAKTNLGDYLDKKRFLLTPKKNEKPSEEYLKACDDYKNINEYLRSYLPGYQKAYNEPLLASSDEAKENSIQALISIFEHALGIANEVMSLLDSRKINR